LLSTFKYNVLIVPKTSFLNVTVNVVFVANANLADAASLLWSCPILRSQLRLRQP